MEGKKYAGIWIRVSTEDQAKGDSPQHHEYRARQYAEARGWEVKTVYHLEALSGKSIMDYAETKRMMRDVETGEITGLLFSKLARVARNTVELLQLDDFFRKHHAHLISLEEAIDTTTPIGRHFFTQIASNAQWEREETAARVAASIPVRAQLGKPLGGAAPFGFAWVNKQLVVDDAEAPVRKLMYELFLKHRRKKTTAKELNTLGYRTRNGGKFTDTTIGRLLRDTTAKGVKLANYTKSTGNKKKWVYKDEKDWIKTPCPAIVLEEIWNECNRILDEQEKKRRKPGPKPVHLLAGLISCTCGKRMYVFHTTKTPTYTCKDCKNRISVETIDEAYHEQLKTFFLTDSDIADYIEKTDSIVEEKEALLSKITADSNAIRKRMNDLVALRLDGEMNKENFAQYYKPLEEQIYQIDAQIPELKEEIEALKTQRISSSEGLQEAKTLYDHWNDLPYEQKREIVEMITEHIIVGNDEIQLTLSHIPTLSKMSEKSNAAMPVWLL